MRNVFWIVILLVTACGHSLAQENAPPQGFRALFNGQDLSGWYGLGPKDYWSSDPNQLAAKREASYATIQSDWRVEQGDLVNGGKGLYLTTEEEFGDIELTIDYKTVAKADSGIYLRATPQVQIWDWTEAGKKWRLGADKGSGGLYNNKSGIGKDPLALADRPFGQWNRFRIRQIGARTSVWLNNHLVVDNAPLENFWQRDQPLFARGPIQLQTHGGEIRWKNIFVREIEAAEANALLAEADDGFESIFNGRDLSGWSGATDSYEVKNGAIVCKPDQGGNLFTNEVYADFIVRLEFQLPPGGNNGLAIRYPGEGNPAYEGMCELQVLDSEHARYNKLDSRQYHGSAYGMIAAHRGYLRPTGQWNFQEVTVVGSRVTVELNGYVILDGDLAAVNEYLGERAHPGKNLTQGHFGFAGHRDPVAFRNIQIKRLTAARADGPNDGSQ